VAADFVGAYRDESMIAGFPCATIAVVKSSEMEALAGTIRNLNLRENEVTSTAGLQYYEGLTRPGHLFYDLDHYLNTIRGNATPTEYNAYKAQLGRTVIYKDHTAELFSGFPRYNGSFHPVDKNHFSGLAVFIPWSETASFIPDYRETEWYRYVYAE
jgi:hypothetical protein